MKKSPLFITIEGVDGAGKSSHLSHLNALLASTGKEVVQTREPGGTPLGETLRTIMLNKPMDITTEVLLAFASRAEHLKEVIRPALEAGNIVLCDRFTDSTYAYQGKGSGFPTGSLNVLETMVHGDLQPDLTLLFDLPVEESLRRLGKTSKDPDKFEQKSKDYFEHVRQGYQERQKAYPERLVVIDSSQPFEAVVEQVQQVVKDFLIGQGFLPPVETVSNKKSCARP